MTLIPPESKIQPWLVGYGHARTAPLIIPAMAAQRPGTLADEQEQGTDRLNTVQGWVTKSPPRDRTRAVKSCPAMLAP